MNTRESASFSQKSAREVLIAGIHEGVLSGPSLRTALQALQQTPFDKNWPSDRNKVFPRS